MRPTPVRDAGYHATHGCGSSVCLGRRNRRGDPRPDTDTAPDRGRRQHRRDRRHRRRRRPRAPDGGTAPGSDAGPPTAGGPDDPEGPPFSSTARKLIAAAVALVLVAAVVLRLWTRSDLWLDEALTVNIARLPLHEIPAFLRRDGAPPLYYVLLHFWISAFGTSDVAVRSLSALFGVITLPLIWLAGKRLGGRPLGWAALLLLATSPFAIRYDTETRMYSLVALLTVLGFLALDRSLRQPRPGNLIAVARGHRAAALHPLLVAVPGGHGHALVAWEAWRGRPEWRAGARASFVAAVVVGASPSCPGCRPSGSSPATPAPRGPRRPTSPPWSTRCPRSPVGAPARAGPWPS